MTDALFHFDVGPKTLKSSENVYPAYKHPEFIKFMLTSSYTELHCHGPALCTACMDLTIYPWYRGSSYIISVFLTVRYFNSYHVFNLVSLVSAKALFCRILMVFYSAGVFPTSEAK